jgi:hypothetical protein
MKTRNGFVSNSSTTSFVAIGYKIDENTARRFLSDVMQYIVTDDYDVLDIIDEEDTPIEEIGEYGLVLGKVFRFSSEDGSLDENINKDIDDIVAEVKNYGEKAGLGNPRLFTGMYMS